MIDMKNFRLYVPDTLPDGVAESGANVLFLQDEAGADWYQVQQQFKANSLKIAYRDDGAIVSMSRDVSMLWPLGLSVAEISKPPADIEADGSWQFIDGKVSRAPVDHITVAEARRAELLRALAERIDILQDAEGLDIITDAERNELQALKKCRVDISRLDLSAGPAVEWPEVPGDVVA